MTEANSTRAAQRAASVRTALTLAVVALVSFSGIILAQRFGPSMIGLGALGVAVVGFPLAAMMGRGSAR
jgi:hypothetical protein